MRPNTMFLQLLMNILLYILVMAIASPIEENATYVRNSKTISFDVLVSFHYDLKISLMPGYVLHGESTIAVYIHRPTRYIKLFTSDYISITRAYLTSVANGNTYVPFIFDIVMKDNVVLDFYRPLLPEDNLKVGFYTLYINFSFSVTDKLWQTWYTDEEKNKKFIATLFQPSERLPIFPCFHTYEYVTFNISVEHDTRDKVLSNMPIKNQSISNDVMLTFFDTFPYTYIYEVTLILMTSDMTPSDPISFDSDNFPYSKIRINTWSRSLLVPHMKFARHVLENVIKYLDDNWNIMRRGPKIDCVVIPNFEGNIMQTWGLLLYNETYITYNEELYPAYKGTAMRLIVHEIIYQWFDGFFFPRHNHWVLNEGFVKFTEVHIIKKVFPNTRMMDLFIIQDQHDYRYMDVHFPINIYAIFTTNRFKIRSFSIRQRIIGPIVWRMLESIIPNNSFWESINTFLNTDSTDNWRIPSNLWDIMQILIDRSEIKNYKMDVKRMINVWAEQKYCPVVNAIRDYNGAYVNISIDKKLDQLTFFIPITYTTEINIDFNPKLSTVDYYLTETNPELKIPIKNEDQWIIIDKQQTGYYRVNYDPENWRKITRYLNSENYTNIHVLNRAQIIDDAFHLAMEKKLNFSIFWNLASYLPRREKDYIAWYPMIKAFEYLSNYFAIISVPDKDLPLVLKEVSVKIKEMFEDKKEHIYTFLYRYEDINQVKLVENDFNEYLKLALTKWGCVIKNNLCMEMAKNKLELYVLNSTLNKISPGWEKWTYCNGLKTANESMWYTVYLMASRMYKEKSDYKMLEYLGCSENPNIIVKYLWTVLPEVKQDMLRENDHKMFTQKNKNKINTLITNMFLSTLARHAKNIRVLKEILASYKIYYKDSPICMTTALNVLINNAYAYKQLFEISIFAKKNMSHSEYKKFINPKLITYYHKLDNQQQFFYNLFT